jgi:predicted RecB family nuclease
MGIKKTIKPSDATSWAYCTKRVWLDHDPSISVEDNQDDFGDLIIKMGMDHEDVLLKQFQSEDEVHIAKSAEHTKRLMDHGVPVIYQGELIDDNEGFIGKPDFLIRDDSGEYQVADAKLSMSAEKKIIQVQLGLYRRMLHSILPALVFLGNGETAEIGSEVDPLVDLFVEEMRYLLTANEPPAVKYSHSRCRACPYYSVCTPNFENIDDLSLLYGVDGRAAINLEKEGIKTISKLSESNPALIPDVPFFKGFDKKQRAVLQAKSYQTGEVYVIKDVLLPVGDWVHFDIEDNPLTDAGAKHVYLWGFLVPNYQDDNFEYVWTNDADQDYEGWISFLDKVRGYQQRFDHLILAHYSNHEVSTIKTYAKRYSMESDKTVQYLLSDDGPLFDMQKPILQSLVLPLRGYGLKDICKHKELVDFQWSDEESGSQWSIVQFHNFLNEQCDGIRSNLKRDILGYNRDDVLATRFLEEWLRGIMK